MKRLFIFSMAFNLILAEEKADSLGNKLPLKPTRNVAFTTSEGTWMSLDVSSDGKTIIFDLLGDLYTLPFRGGDAQQLTFGIAFDSQPVYSPNAQMIAFVSDPFKYNNEIERPSIFGSALYSNIELSF